VTFILMVKRSKQSAKKTAWPLNWRPTILWTVQQYYPSNTVSRPSRFESSATLLWEPQILNFIKNSLPISTHTRQELNSEKMQTTTSNTSTGPEHILFSHLVCMAMPWSTLILTGLSPQRQWFDPKPVDLWLKRDTGTGYLVSLHVPKLFHQ
jgi:hypothetical protein